MFEQYEYHKYKDENFPILFHEDFMSFDGSETVPPTVRVYNKGYCHTHWHEAIELLLIRKGNIEVSINGEMISASDGNIVVINSNRIHTISAENGPCYYYCLILNRELLRQWGFDIQNTHYEQLLISRDIADEMCKICEEFNNQGESFKQMVTSRCIKIMVLLERQFKHQAGEEYTPSQKTKRVQEIIEYINGNYSRPLSLEDISRRFGYSSFYLSHLFSRYTDISVSEFIISVRISAAMGMLRDGNMPVSAVAERCGYKNQSSFSVIFRKKTGMTPNEYRNSAIK